MSRIHISKNQSCHIHHELLLIQWNFQIMRYLFQRLQNQLMDHLILNSYSLQLSCNSWIDIKEHTEPHSEELQSPCPEIIVILSIHILSAITMAQWNIRQTVPRPIFTTRSSQVSRICEGRYLVKLVLFRLKQDSQFGAFWGAYFDFIDGNVYFGSGK